MIEWVEIILGYDWYLASSGRLEVWYAEAKWEEDIYVGRREGFVVRGDFCGENLFSQFF